MKNKYGIKRWQAILLGLGGTILAAAGARQLQKYWNAKDEEFQVALQKELDDYEADKRTASDECDRPRPNQPSAYDVIAGEMLIRGARDMKNAIPAPDEREFVEWYHTQPMPYSPGQAYRDFKDLKKAEEFAGKGGDVRKWSETEPQGAAPVPEKTRLAADISRNNDAVRGYFERANLPYPAIPRDSRDALKLTEWQASQIYEIMAAEDSVTRDFFAGKNEGDFSYGEILILSKMYDGNFGEPGKDLSNFEKAAEMIKYFGGAANGRTGR